jgi:DNA-binding CsgD family transcriptional regulator
MSSGAIWIAGIYIAAVAVQSFGDFQNFHPHLHVLSTDGYFYNDAAFRVCPPPNTGDLRHRKTKLKDLRQMGMELSYRYSNYKQKEIGAIFGIDYSTVSQSRARLKTKLKSSRKLKKQFQRIQEQIDKMSN